MKNRILIISLLILTLSCKKDKEDSKPAEDTSWKPVSLKGIENNQAQSCMRDASTLLIAVPNGAVFMDVSKGMGQATRTGNHLYGYSADVLTKYIFTGGFTIFFEGEGLSFYEYQFYPRGYAGWEFDTAFKQFTGLCTFNKPLAVIDKYCFTRYITKQGQIKGLLLEFDTIKMKIISFKTIDLQGLKGGNIYEFNNKFYFSNYDYMGNNYNYSVDLSGNIQTICGYVVSSFQQNDTFFSLGSKGFAIDKNDNCFTIDGHQQFSSFSYAQTSEGVLVYKGENIYKLILTMGDNS